MPDRDLTKTELHNKKLEALAEQLRKDLKEFVRKTVLKNVHRFNGIDDVRFMIDKFDFTAADVLDAGFRRSLWSEIELQKTKEKKSKQKQHIRKTWEYPKSK